MIKLYNLASTTHQLTRREDKAKYLLTTDPLFSLCVKLHQENKLLKDLLDDREKPPQGLVEEELGRIRQCNTI